jgi:ferritin
MLSDKVLNKLNEQITLEHYSANQYLAMSSWCSFKGYDASADFLFKHCEEEMAHMKKLFRYVCETGGLAEVREIRKPIAEFESLVDVFQKTFAHEKLVTRAINDLAHVAFTESDYSTFNFLQWYVAEQHEEERLFQTVLNKIEVIGTTGKGIFLIDQEIGKLAG